MKGDEWWDRMACRDVDPSIFDAERRIVRGQWAEAKATCGKCPVRAECLKYVLEMPLDFYGDQSFAAGHTPDEINQMRRNRR